MKKIIITATIICAIGIVSCQNNESHDPAQDSLNSEKSATPINDNNVNNPRALNNNNEWDEGAVLVANNDCKTCHAMDTKMVGPSYNDIANKYENSAGYRDEMAYKIVQGGYGRWGTERMPGHPNVSIPEARQMAGYILSLKTK